MGRLIYSMSVSLDGLVETPSRSLDWVQFDEELHAAFSDEARAMGTFLYRRRMYELMIDYWPTAESDPSAAPAMQEFARIWRDTPKVVFSRTLGRVDWNSPWSATTPWRSSSDSRRKPRSTWTSADKRWPLRSCAGLVDEYRVFVQPVILGAGTPFFPALDERIGLTLLETRTFGSGVVFLRYGTVSAPG